MTSASKLYIYKGSDSKATLVYTFTFNTTKALDVSSSGGSTIAEVKTAVTGSGAVIAVAAGNSGITGAALALSAGDAAKLKGGDEAITFAADSDAISGKVSVTTLEDEDIKAAITRDGSITGTLADAAALGDGERVFKLTLGDATFYLVGKLSADLKTSGDKYAVELDGTPVLYNAAGVKVTDLSQGLGLESTSLKISPDGSKSVPINLMYDPAKETFSLETAEGSLSNLTTTVTFGTDGKTIESVSNSVFQNAELLGKASTTYTKIVSDANADVTSEKVGKDNINANYITEKYETEDAFKAALAGAVANISYVEHEGGSYTGIIALGSDATNGALKNTVSLVDQSGTTVTSLYAKYSFGTTADSFKLEGLYTDKGASSESANTNIAIGEDGKSIIFGSGDTALTYSLSAASYSDVTISLTSGTITYDNTTISLTSGAITNDKTAAATTAVAFRTESSSSGTTAVPAFQFEVTGTDTTAEI